MLKDREEVKNADGENLWWQEAELFKLARALRTHQPKDIYSPVYGAEADGEQCALMIQAEMSWKIFQ